MSDDSLHDRFRLLEKIRATDSEQVFRAFDQVLEREVFLKMLGPGLLGASRREQTTCLREARVLAKLRHPGVVHLLDVLGGGAGATLVLDPVPGEPLADRLHREGCFEPEEVRRLGVALCDALAAVHAAGVVHRGVSADNIVLRPDGAPCLTGFSFAKPGGLGLGTSLDYRVRDEPAAPAFPPHPAPEQLRGQVADARSDLFALGCVLFESLAGTPAFEAGREDRPARSLRKLAPTAPRPLCAAIQQCLQLSPSRRFQTAIAMRDALETASRATRAPRRRYAAIGAVALAAVAVLLWAAQQETVSPDRGKRLPNRGRQGARATYAPYYESSRALLVGIDYGSASSTERLANAERDVHALADILRNMNARWTVKSLVGDQATREGILGELTELERRTVPNDRVLIYYAGHGKGHSETGDTGWIVPCDALGDASATRIIRFSELRERVREIRAKHVLLMLDCCHGQRIVPIGGVFRGPPTARPLEKYLEHPAKVVVASASRDQRAPDGAPAAHSPFARAFFACLQDRDTAFLTASGLFARIQSSMDETSPHQVPAMTSFTDGPGEFLFFPGSEPPTRGH